MSDKLAQIIDTVKALTVMELADLVKALEKEFGVSAAAVAGPAGPAAVAAVEAPTSFKVTLVEVPADKKISAIKCVREILGLGLADAKAFVEGVPKVVKEGIEKVPADELAKKLTEAGGKAKIEGA